MERNSRLGQYPKAGKISSNWGLQDGATQSSIKILRNNEEKFPTFQSFRADISVEYRGTLCEILEKSRNSFHRALIKTLDLDPVFNSWHFIEAICYEQCDISLDVHRCSTLVEIHDGCVILTIVDNALNLGIVWF